MYVYKKCYCVFCTTTNTLLPGTFYFTHSHSEKKIFSLKELVAYIHNITFFTLIVNIWLTDNFIIIHAIIKEDEEEKTMESTHTQNTYLFFSYFAIIKSLICCSSDVGTSESYNPNQIDLQY